MRARNAGMLRENSTPSKRIAPVVGAIRPAEKLQQGGLAGAVGAEQRDALAGSEIKIQISERPQEAVRLGEFVDGYAQRLESDRFYEQ